MSRGTNFSKVSLWSLMGGAVLSWGPLSYANEAPAPAAADAADSGDRSATGALEEVTVLGRRTTPEIAREAQKQASNLINLTTVEEMQRLPDVNTGEAIRRVPGISLETDTGEGRFINIRGLDADLNSTTFGGLRLPPTNNSSPSGAGRAVAFDSIPIGFVGAIKVVKSNLPELDAEALGGTIDITPRTVAEDGKLFADLRVGTGQELLRHTWITDLAATSGLRFGGDGDYKPFSGFETNYVQHFVALLPGPLGGLGVSVNWTWVDSSYRQPVADPVTGLTTGTRDLLLPSTSRNTANAEILYDLYGLSTTLGAYYTSGNIFGLGNTAATDIWTQERFSVDFGAQYKVTDSFKLYTNLKNLTNTPLKFTEGPGQDRVIQREFYGVTVQAGFNYTL